MSEEVTEENWHYYENLDLGELNELNNDIYETRSPDGDGRGVFVLQEMFKKHYGYDVMGNGNSGPYAAVVLEVLSGPQVKDKASANGKFKTKSLNLDSFPDPLVRGLKLANAGPPVSVIAKVPEFDADIKFPKDSQDRLRIDAHGEYHQFKEDEKLSQIQVGSIIWITYSNNDAQASFTGRPTGKIIGLHKAAAFADIKTSLSPEKAYKPRCQAAVNKTGPAGGLYPGNTDKDPNPNFGPPIRKIKGNIKTGFYGAGTAQTKAHFDASLEGSLTSPKHQISGPAPGSNNAFIWIGTLKNNGYMDLLDRPIGQGRETIIYAPMTLDLTAPIEIKYYFHDVGGFGYAHLGGPSTTIAEAEINATLPANDFREKIAPGIKDLNRDGRNYILVIPEMAYSLGFGTANGDIARINKLIEGERVSAGVFPGNSKDTVRTIISSDTRGPIRNYLNNIPIEAGKNLVQNTPLRERQLSTFDGSYTGGNFGNFHQEVLDVLDQHLTAGADLTVGFVSIVADGLGAVALSAITKKVANSAAHAKGASSFKNTFTAKPLKIDYITNSIQESSTLFSSYFGTSSPAASFLNDFLRKRDAVTEYTEFNYITSPATTTVSEFFDNLGKIEDYKKQSKDGTFFSYSSEPNSNASKLSFLLGNSVDDQRFVSMHVLKDNVASGRTRAGYSMSMVNDFLSSFSGYPKKPNENTGLKPSFNAVPDHYYTLMAKPSPGDLEKLNKKQQALLEPVEYFRELIETIIKPYRLGLQSGEGFFEACKKPKYKVFCDNNGAIDHSFESKFSKSYREYLQKEKELAEVNILKQGETIILKLTGFKDQIEKQIEIYKPLLATAKTDRDEGFGGESFKEKWNLINSSFYEYTKMASLGEFDPNFYNIPTLANILVAPEAFAKILAKLESAKNRLEPAQVEKPADCVPQPVSLDQAKSATGLMSRDEMREKHCMDIKQFLNTTPATAISVFSLLGYYEALIDPPKKSDYAPYAGRPKISKKKTTKFPDDFKTNTFKYPARGLNNATTNRESPRVWSCLSGIIEKGWKEACEETGYYPFFISSGLKGSESPPTAGVAAYEKGLSLHALGLAIDIDPHLTGFSKNTRKAVNSIWTGAWTPRLFPASSAPGKQLAQELHKLGVYQTNPSQFAGNVGGLQPVAGSVNPATGQPFTTYGLRRVENWKDAPSVGDQSSQSAEGETAGGLDPRDQRNSDVMQAAKGGPIVPMDADPTLWIILFCEKTGMKWGNATFLKKRFKGGRTWKDEEKTEISRLFGIENIVDRVQAISWNGDHDNHMHFQFWDGDKGIITWKELEAAADADDL